MKILIVDDDPAALLVASMALQDIGGFEVITAENGKEAIEKAISERPESLLIDMVMEDLDGRDVLMRLRTNELTRKIPVIFHTAMGEPRKIEELVALGAAGVISKPFDPLQLSKEVRRLLHLAEEAPHFRPTT